MQDSATLGIDVGSTNVKLCLLSEDGSERHAIAPHEGNLDQALSRLSGELSLATAKGLRVLATGTEGRHRLRAPNIIAAEAIERALHALELQPRAVVSMGGEDLVVYVLDAQGHIVSNYSGNKCASGTGEFFRQQLGRMDLLLTDVDRVAEGAKLHKLSARCSVFMKSDCTHRLNKGEATKGDIALSLSKVMADKVSEFLTKAKIHSGDVLLVGGVTQNRFLVQFLRDAWPDIRFIVPKQAAYFEAFGAAQAARESGDEAPQEGLLTSAPGLSYTLYAPLADLESQVRYAPSMRGTLDPDAEYILGIDGGSTTTKAALVNRKTLEIVAAYYGRTHGDPVAALKHCLQEIQKQLGGQKPKITLAATTGSSRELLGVFAETAGVYNEIIAHTVGTIYFEPEADTIFEIGGQDAKYVLINNGVPIDYAMNEACSAGTGSFLEESARGDLCIDDAADIGPIALAAKTPLKFGEHCSAFINSDIRKAIQQGAAREDIVAGLVFSIVSNYLNRVVGNRTIGDHIMLQGGVAKNPAVPLAFARLTGKKVVVPPDPELMGCFGVARLARQKADEGLLAEGSFDLETLLTKEITYRNSFKCNACDNYCEIKNLEVSSHRYPFGGRCSKYTGARRRKKAAAGATETEGGTDYTAVRTRMLFEEFVPNPAELVPRTSKVVGVPLALSVHSLWPLYAWYFHALGVKTVLSRRIAPLGIARQESNYCYPVEIAHGAIQDILDAGADYVFLPQFRDMPSMEKGEVHACLCPLMQGIPFMARQAFGLGDDRILRPLVAFKHGYDASRPAFAELAESLGFTAAEGRAAYDKAVAELGRFLTAYRKLGDELLEEMRQHPEKLYVALQGRPYNAFSRDANMGIPRKLVSHGVTVVPFDMIYDDDEEIFPNMYWYYGQQNMKAVRKVKGIDNLYLTWVSNFSCAPDSFMLHYVRWMMGQKPYLVLEIDSHTADAGVDTRIEAFLDIVESYRRAALPKAEPPREPRYRIARKEEFCDVLDTRTGERFDIRDPRVTLVWPSMGDLGVELMTAASAAKGIKSVHLPVPDVRSTQLAREVASGKECIPALLVLGSILQFFEKAKVNQPDEVFVVFVPSTLGPCRTGQYHVFYERLFQDLGWENVTLLVAGSETSYREFGAAFNQHMWWTVVLGDYFTDARTGIRLLAENVDEAMKVFHRVFDEVKASFRDGLGAVQRTVAEAARELARIPKRRRIDDLKKVLVVGEIYVRRDNFSVEELSEFLIAKDIYPKVTGVSEWILYTDYARDFLLKERRQREGLLKAARGGWLKEVAIYHVEAWWKNWIERKVHHMFEPTGLVPEVPHDMHTVIEDGRGVFVEPELESEATVSPAVAAASMKEGYSGVAIIAPFACLPGRLIEGVYAPWAKARGYPVIALENDGQPYPPNIVSRMEVFAHNVVRFTPKDETADEFAGADAAAGETEAASAGERSGELVPEN